MRKQTLKLALTSLILIPLLSGITGNREGNGGDHVRGMFIKMGRSVLQFLKETQSGAEIIKNKELDIGRIEAALNIESISVVEGELKDNGGADVDATGEPGKVTLRKGIWMDHLEKERDVYYLVFHEMLRAAGYNDDNYVLSSGLHPFPKTMRVPTRITPLLPLIAGDLVSDIINPDEIAFQGTGCSINDGTTYVDFDAEKNVIEASFDGYRMISATDTLLAESRKACAMAIPLRVPDGKRLVISQLDLAGKVKLPVGSKAVINLEAFTAGAIGPKIKKTVTAIDKDEVGRVQIRLADFFSTGCGGSPILRLNTSGNVSGGGSDPAVVKIDRLALYLRVDDCRYR